MREYQDRTVDEFVALLKSFSSEYYGSLIDFGNNIALCEESMSVVRKLAPYVKSMHLKDMAVKTYDQGFLLSEVVCGRGFLDVKGMVTLCRRSNPKIHINLEMITDQVLKVPVEADVYWATFPERRATTLPAIRNLVNEYASQEMPRTDDLSSTSCWGGRKKIIDSAYSGRETTWQLPGLLEYAATPPRRLSFGDRGIIAEVADRVLAARGADEPLWFLPKPESV
jgi:hypothetical protein